MIQLIHDPSGYEYYAKRALSDGREAVVIPLTFGRARICVGPQGAFWFDDNW